MLNLSDHESGCYLGPLLSGEDSSEWYPNTTNMGLFEKVSNALGSDSTDASDETADADASFDPFNVPESVVDLVDISKRIEIISEHYDKVSARQARTIAKTLKEHLEDTDGYSHNGIKRDLEGKVDIDDELLETIVWTEISSIQMINRIQGYLDSSRHDHVYKIIVSDNGHPICVEARDEIEARDGVTLEELTRILLDNAEEHPDGTPDRMDHWVPHERCKSAVVRHFPD